MRTGPILILLACLLPLCGCDLFFDDEVWAVEWEVYEAEAGGTEASPRIRIKVNSTRNFDSKNTVFFYHDLKHTQPLNTNKLVYINGSPLPGAGGRVAARGDSFNIYPPAGTSVKTGDVFTFDPSWFFALYTRRMGEDLQYKVRIITGSFVYEEEE